MDTQKRILALNDAFGADEEMLARMRLGQMNPLDVMTVGARGYDTAVGAPTRSAIGAAMTGENPATAAYNQFGENPDLAPDFGIVGNAVADPFLLASAGKMAVKAAPSLMESAPRILGNELGAIGERPEFIRNAESILAKYGDSPEGAKVAKALQYTEQKGAGHGAYIDLRKQGIPNPLPNYSAEGNVIGPKGGVSNFYNDAFNWHDTRYGAGKRLLENAKGPLDITTGSDLIAHDDYLSLIPSGSKITIQANTGEVIAPSAKRLATAIKKIKAERPDVQVIMEDVGNIAEKNQGMPYNRPLSVEMSENRLGQVPEGWGKIVTEAEARPVNGIDLRGIKKGWEPPQAETIDLGEFMELGKKYKKVRKQPERIDQEQLRMRLKVLDGNG